MRKILKIFLLILTIFLIIRCSSIDKKGEIGISFTSDDPLLFEKNTNILTLPKETEYALVSLSSEDKNFKIQTKSVKLDNDAKGVTFKGIPANEGYIVEVKFFDLYNLLLVEGKKEKIFVQPNHLNTIEVPLYRVIGTLNIKIILTQDFITSYSNSNHDFFIEFNLLDSSNFIEFQKEVFVKGISEISNKDFLFNSIPTASNRVLNTKIYMNIDGLPLLLASKTEEKVSIKNDQENNFNLNMEFKKGDLTVILQSLKSVEESNISSYNVTLFDEDNNIIKSATSLNSQILFSNLSPNLYFIYAQGLDSKGAVIEESEKIKVIIEGDKETTVIIHIK